MDFLKKIIILLTLVLVSFGATVYQIVKKDTQELKAPQEPKAVIILAIVMIIGTISLGLLPNCIWEYIKPPITESSSSSIILIPNQTGSENEGNEETSQLTEISKESIVNSSSTEVSRVAEVESVFENASEVSETNSTETVSYISEKDNIDTSLPKKAMIGNVSYATLQNAIDDSNCGDTITVVSDIQEDIRIVDGKDIIIDLNNCTVSNNSYHTFYIEGSVTFVGGNVDSTVNEKAAVVIDCGGNAIFRECDITRSGEKKGNSYYTIVNRGKLFCEKCDIENGSLNQYKDRKSAILNGYTHAGENILDFRNNKDEVKAELKVKDCKIYGGNNAVRNGIFSVLNVDNSDLYGYEHAFSNRGEAVLENSMLYGVEAVFCDKKESFHEDITQSVQIKECMCSSENGVFLDDKMLHENGQMYTNVVCDFLPNVSCADNGDGTYSILGQ